ncbi:hypothetical protein Tco_0910754 [Tanacetum coccineum]|uniref:Uncharacterized protein n=1 Tax=Tanacetum coccineum TaxID=301880 RepID=A0ABQ5D042_9ASTR
MDGSYTPYKVRSCAKGYAQTHGLDSKGNDHLFSTLGLLGILIAIARTITMIYGKWMSKLPSPQWYLNEEDYMEQPKVKMPDDHVYIVKSYGSKSIPKLTVDDY